MKNKIQKLKDKNIKISYIIIIYLKDKNIKVFSTKFYLLFKV